MDNKLWKGKWIIINRPKETNNKQNNIINEEIKQGKINKDRIEDIKEHVNIWRVNIINDRK